MNTRDRKYQGPKIRLIGLFKLTETETINILKLKPKPLPQYLETENYATDRFLTTAYEGPFNEDRDCSFQLFL